MAGAHIVAFDRALSWIWVVDRTYEVLTDRPGSASLTCAIGSGWVAGAVAAADPSVWRYTGLVDANITGGAGPSRRTYTLTGDIVASTVPFSMEVANAFLD